MHINISGVCEVDVIVQNTIKACVKNYSQSNKTVCYQMCHKTLALAVRSVNRLCILLYK